jgi:hypothetical protein
VAIALLEKLNSRAYRLGKALFEAAIRKRPASRRCQFLSAASVVDGCQRLVRHGHLPEREIITEGESPPFQARTHAGSNPGITRRRLHFVVPQQRARCRRPTRRLETIAMSAGFHTHALASSLVPAPNCRGSCPAERYRVDFAGLNCPYIQANRYCLRSSLAAERGVSFMGKSYSQELREAVIQALAAGCTREQVARDHRVSLSSVGRFRKRWRATGNVRLDKFGASARH